MNLKVYANIHDQLTEESADPNKVMEHIKDLAKQLHTNVSFHVKSVSVVCLHLEHSFTPV